MNRSYRLLIADSDVTYSNYLRNCLRGNSRLTVIGVANEGTTALKMIQSEKPDILLIDPLLPEIDGLTIIRNTIQNHHSIRSIICLSQFYSQISVELARRSGVSNYLYKPIDTDSLISMLIYCADIAEEMCNLSNIQEELTNTSEIHRKIRAILHELGFSSKLNGSRYIEESVAIAHESPMLLHNIHSGLYQHLAQRNHINPANIERCIRTAITAANVDGRLSKRINGNPTNKTCIRFILSLLAARI